jgi:preprotein translocase subunit SecD
MKLYDFGLDVLGAQVNKLFTAGDDARGALVVDGKVYAVTTISGEITSEQWEHHVALTAQRAKRWAERMATEGWD